MNSRQISSADIMGHHQPHLPLPLLIGDYLGSFLIHVCRDFYPVSASPVSLYRKLLRALGGIEGLFLFSCFSRIFLVNLAIFLHIILVLYSAGHTSEHDVRLICSQNPGLWLLALKNIQNENLVLTFPLSGVKTALTDFFHFKRIGKPTEIWDSMILSCGGLQYSCANHGTWGLLLTLLL